MSAMNAYVELSNIETAVVATVRLTARPDGLARR